MLSTSPERLHLEWVNHFPSTSADWDHGVTRQFATVVDWIEGGMLAPRVYSGSVIPWLQQNRRSQTPRLIAWTICATFLLWITAWHIPTSSGSSSIRSEQPLVRDYIENARGTGGRWFVPREWLSFEDRFLQPYPDLTRYMDIRNPRSPAEAAQLALELCMRRKLYLRHTNIPLIVHQTWKDVDVASWSQGVRDGVEAWLEIATGKAYPDLPKMAYILWDDTAVEALIALYERDMYMDFLQLPRPVEKADVFRVAVLKWFGGVYVDIDTDPLQHPHRWLSESDISSWVDRESRQNHSLYEPKVKSYQAPADTPFRPNPWPESEADLTPASYNNSMTLYKPTALHIDAIFGLEADTPSESDQYWRAGYSYPVQLTNWALAMAPHHPVAINFMQQVTETIRTNATRLDQIDPLDITGPPALTKIVKIWSEDCGTNFSWNSVSGLSDPKGGRGKVVAGDVMVLPITGFSPGRGTFNNMGSQAIDHPSARLRHIAQGSWRHKNLKVELGKVCRTVLGRCRDWSQVP